MSAPQHPQVRKGRGAVSNPEGRFETRTRMDFDDGWSVPEEELPPLETTVMPERARSIITHNDSPDISFSQSINPYRGCEHGCVYCYARPAHAYVNLSPGLDFETKLFYKAGAAELLEKELRKPGYRCQSIALGTNTDPYQPIERKYRVMRSLLEVMQRYRQPLSIVTKGAALMERDLDILSEMGRAQLAMVAISITSLKDEIKRTLEPRAASPASRLRMIRKLSEAGVPVMVMVAPVIPVVTDSEMEDILQAARDAGALAAGYVMLRLPWEVKDLFKDWLDAHHPLKAQHVMSLVRQIRGGEAEHTPKDAITDPENYNQETLPEPASVTPSPYRRNPYYSAQWGQRQRGVGEFAGMIEKRFRLACKRLGLNRWHDLRLDTGQFRVPPAPGDQLTLSL
jgi:DNA repair photolyase